MFGNRMPDYHTMLDYHFAEEAREFAKLPECCECGEKIQDEECCEFDGFLICPKCLDDNHRKVTEDCKRSRQQGGENDN